MRILALLLLLANIAVYCWARYVAAPEVTLVSTPVPIHSSEAPPLALVNESSQSQSTASLEQAQCVSVGPIEDEATAGSLGDRLQAAGLTSTQRIESKDEFAGYWVTVEKFASKAQADKALQQLHDGGISDAYIFTDEATSQVLSLGLFSERSRAEARRGAAAKLGFEASINDRSRQIQNYWLDVMLQFAGQTIDAKWLKTGKADDIVRLQTKSCQAAEE